MTNSTAFTTTAPLENIHCKLSLKDVDVGGSSPESSAIQPVEGEGKLCACLPSCFNIAGNLELEK
jgi:hypothetical protein